jgi:hypothetical protein
MFTAAMAQTKIAPAEGIIPTRYQPTRSFIMNAKEIKAALDSVTPCLEDRDILYSRAIEAAIMAKFENVAMVKEPFFGTTSNEITKHLPPFTHLYVLKETL